jgi:pentatricopeptide repeat protein
MCDQATYNALFQGLVKIDKVDEMWHMFGVMKERGIAPSNLSLHTVISALIVHNRLDDAYATFLELKASSLYSARAHTHTHTHTHTHIALFYLLICEVKKCEPRLW